jgi:hypothetical protein
MAENHVIGIQEVQRRIDQLGRVPAKALTTSVKKGALIARQYARENAPTKTGTLKRGIRIIAEKRKTGKKVYQIVFDRKYNDKFQKFTVSGKQYYYPASQEFGFKKKNGGTHPGKHFMKDSLHSQKRLIEQTILDELAGSLRPLGVR